MESVKQASENISSGGAGPSLIKHVFNFDDDSKNEMMNIIQYSLMAVIPIVFLNKSIQKFVPDIDEEKGSLEVLAEVIGQIVVMFIGILLIHRLITYIPTYSNVKYADFNIINIILGFLVIVLSLQTKLGEKVNLLLERIIEVVEGKVNIKEGQQNQQANGVSVSQPISQSGYIDNVNYQAGNPPVTGTVSAMSNQGTQQQPNFNQMYAGPKNPLQNAATPQVQESFGGYQAANEVCAGFGGSSLF
tara:strand:+ start:2602 stop:3339 length:738 start_codon:yes stop_codon:yes gene_type:complete